MDGDADESIARGDDWPAEAERRVRRARESLTDQVVSPAVWFLFTVIWLLFLFYPIQESLTAHLSPARLCIALAGMVTFVGFYLWLMLHDPFGDTPLTPGEIRLHVALILAITAIVLSLTLAYSINWLWFIMYANMATAVKLPVRVSAPTITILTLLTFLVGRTVADWSIASRIVSPVAAVAVVMIGISRLVVTIRELRTARLEIARLAVAEERLRFARDLHDLLGHSLSAITLKNELARRMVPTQPDRAVQEIDEAITMARAALREVREAVSGYRQPTLPTELQSAREILEAAGIAADYHPPTATLPLPTAVESVLAWAVREGVTNVVRHSHARHCSIAVSHAGRTVSVEIIDDGCGEQRALPPERPRDAAHGLRGLAERVARLHGELEAGPSVMGGFRLRVTVPWED